MASEQRLRDMRHIDICRSINGIIGSCNICKRADVVSNDIIKIGLESIRRSLPSTSNYIHDDFTEISDQKLGLYAITAISTQLHQQEYKLLFDISRYIFNEHSAKHRPSCFKKGVECRFHYPAGLNQLWSIDFGQSQSNQSKPWATLDGIKMAQGFSIMPNRDISDLFLNIHNSTILKWNGFNNNIQLGDPAHIFYNTMYTSKSAVDEDTKFHQNTLLFVKTKIEKDLNIYYQSHPSNNSQGIVYFNDYKVGLIRLLRGITGHLCESVISANLAAHIVSTGTRFHFSHDFCHLMIRQFEEYFAGNTVQYTMRWSKDQRRGYIDSNVFDYIFRPSVFENMCLYQFLSLYESVSRHSVNSTHSSIHEFDEAHPSRDFKILRERTSQCIPIIEGDNFYDLQLLLSEANNIMEKNQYAKRALLLFYPFRSINDLYCTSQDDTLLTWDTFNHLRQDSTSNFWKLGNEILQNHQDRIYNIKHMNRIPDVIERSTQLSTSHSNSNEIIDEETIGRMEDGVFFSSIDADSFIFNDSNYSHENNDLCSNSNRERNELRYDIPYDSRNIVISGEIARDVNTNSGNQSDPRTLQQRPRIQDNIIRIAIGSFLHNNSSFITTNTDPTIETYMQDANTINFHDVARKFNLDEKQTKAFYIQSSSFLYQIISEQTSIRYENILSSIRTNNDALPNDITDKISLLAHLKSVSYYIL